MKAVMRLSRCLKMCSVIPRYMSCELSALAMFDCGSLLTVRHANISFCLCCKCSLVASSVLNVLIVHTGVSVVDECYSCE